MTSARQSEWIGRKGMGLVFIAMSLFAAVPLQADSINYAPANPNVDQIVNFTYLGASPTATPILWKFGDGTTRLTPMGINTVSHVYKKADVFTVTAQRQGSGFPTPVITTNVSVTEERYVTFSPSDPKINQPVTFVTHNFLSSSVRWDFGDGTIKIGAGRETHAYRARKTYTVIVKDLGGASSASFPLSINVQGTPSITFSPARPRAGEAVTFEAANFSSTSLIRWEFGDGTTANDTTPPMMTHIYQNQGTYTVTAYDGGSGAPTAQTSISIRPERLVTFSPQAPRIGEEIAFTAVNFFTPTPRWDFGDGTILDAAGTEVTHVYAKEGSWTVHVYDEDGGAQAAYTLPVTVSPSQGPRSAFAVSYINLRFDDGKAYKVVPKGFGNLTAFAEIKYEGTGVLLAQWKVDGTPFKTVSLTMPFATESVIDSGEIPGLPTVIPGLHEVTLNIIQPQAEFEIPVVRYFVTVDTTSPEQANLDLVDVKNLDDVVLPIDKDSIEAPGGAHFLLKGKVKNEGSRPVPFALLRISLDDKIIDQKLLRDLEPGEERIFETSVFNPAPERKKLNLYLYDISRSPAELLYLKEIAIVPPGKIE